MNVNIFKMNEPIEFEDAEVIVQFARGLKQLIEKGFLKELPSHDSLDQLIDGGYFSSSPRVEIFFLGDDGQTYSFTGSFDYRTFATFKRVTEWGFSTDVKNKKNHI